MMFYRIIGNRIVHGELCDKLGWPLSGEHYTMPDEAFNTNKFIIMRTCHGVGDWGIITALPKLLKDAYPSCEVYIPSNKMLTEIFGKSDRHGAWIDPYDIPTELFKNNPYVDGIVDEWDGEIYHDHFRVYDDSDPNDPLVLQMLRFFRVSPSIDIDYAPMLFFSNEEEIDYGEFVVDHFEAKDYIAFSARRPRAELAEAHNNQVIADRLLTMLHELTDNYNHMPAVVFNTTGEDFNLNQVLSATSIPLRKMLYLISNAKYAVGQQTGIFDTCSRYTTVHVVPHSNALAENYINTVNYETI